MSKTLTVTVHLEDDGSFWAEVEELPGCFASGDSLAELTEALAESISLYLDQPVHISGVEPLKPPAMPQRKPARELRVGKLTLLDA